MSFPQPNLPTHDMEVRTACIIWQRSLTRPLKWGFRMWMSYNLSANQPFSLAEVTTSCWDPVLCHYCPILLITRATVGALHTAWSCLCYSLCGTKKWWQSNRKSFLGDMLYSIHIWSLLHCSKSCSMRYIISLDLHWAWKKKVWRSDLQSWNLLRCLEKAGIQV